MYNSSYMRTLMETVQEIELQEASGVGIINVPPSLLKQVQRYVSSVMLTMAMKKYNTIKDSDPEEAQKLYQYCQNYQRKYGASVLSDANLDKYMNSKHTIPLDKTAIYNDLPENIKKNPKTKQIVSKMTMDMIITSQIHDRGGSHSSSGSSSTVEIVVPTEREMLNSTTDSCANKMMYSIGTVEHELQHAIQHVVLKQLNPKDAQASKKQNYAASMSDQEDEDDAYYASGTEFGPQVRDLSNRAMFYLEKNKNHLSNNKVQDITDAIRYSMSTMGQSRIIQALRNYKHNDRAKKVMKLIYKDVSNFYENELNIEDVDLDTSETDISSGERGTKHLEYPEAGKSTLGDLWLAYANEFNEAPTIIGTYDDIRSLRFNVPYGKVVIDQDASNGDLYVSVKDDSTNSSYYFVVPESKSKELMKNMWMFKSNDMIKQYKAQISPKKSETRLVDMDELIDLVERMVSDSEDFISEPKSLEVQTDSDSMYLIFGGTEDNILVVPDTDHFKVGYNGEVYEVTLETLYGVLYDLVTFYCDESTSIERFDNVIAALFSTDFTEDNLKQLINTIQESSMRSWIDVVDDAEMY